MMTSQSKEPIGNLIHDFEELFATAWSSATFGKWTDKAVRAFGTKGGMLNLEERADNSLRAIVTEIEQSDLGEMFSRSYIERRVDSVLAEIAGLASGEVKAVIAVQVKDLVDSLSKAQVQEHKITVPVAGVRLWPHDRIVKVGKCWIYNLANNQESKWLGMIMSHKEGSDLLKFSPPGGSDHWIKTLVQAVPEDSEKLEEMANKQIREALAVLMLYSILQKHTMIFWPKYPVIQIGARRSSLSNAYVVETDIPSFFAGENIATSALPELLINDVTIQSFNRLNFDRLSSLLTRSPRTEIEAAICKSLEVLYASFNSADPTWKYIGLVTAVESLLTVGQERSIKRNISERLAWLLGEKDKPDDRLKIMKRMEEIYGRRSDIIHDAAKIETLNDDILQLHWFMLNLISRYLESNFKTISELRDWTRSKQLGF
jgi:hypothetical protein